MQVRRLVGLLILVMLCVSCAAQAPYRPYQPGAFTADTGEAMFKSLYRAHKAGYVSEAQMATVDQTYDALKQAQHAYHAAVVKDRVTPALKISLDHRLQALKDLAMRYGVY